LVPDERAALEAEIARLRADNVMLKKELLAHDLPLPAGITPDSTSSAAPPAARPNDTGINRVMGFVEDVWRRLVDMIAGAQRDILQKT
jgi:hypothetical protein